MRHLGFAHLAETNMMPLLLWPTTSVGAGDTSWQLHSWAAADAMHRFVASDFSIKAHCDLMLGARSGWHVNASAWRLWLRQSYRDTALSSLLANVPMLSPNLNTSLAVHHELHAHESDAPSEPTAHSDEDVWRTPVAVMSQAHDAERRQNTQRLLQAIGFRNVTFPSTLKWSDINLQQMTEEGLFSRAFVQRMQQRDDTNTAGYARYAANTLSQILRVRDAAAANEPVIIMEDDLMSAGTLPLVRDRLSSTLGKLPAGADLVFLEYCFESCANLRYHPQFPRLAKAWRPSCSAAILFTVKGAQRVAQHCFPIFDVIDRMYPSLIRKGWLEAYVLSPPAFYQDNYFVSNLERNTKQRHGRYDHTKCNYTASEHISETRHAIHEPLHTAPECWELLATNAGGSAAERFEFEQTDRRQAGVILPSHSPRRLLSALASLEALDIATLARMCVPLPSFVSRHSKVLADGVLPQHMEHGLGDRTMYVWLAFALPHVWKNVWRNESLPGAMLVFSTCTSSPIDGGEVQVQVGRWSLASSCGALLEISKDSDCFGLSHGEVCQLEVSLLSRFGKVLDGVPLRVYFAGIHVYIICVQIYTHLYTLQKHTRTCKYIRISRFMSRICDCDSMPAISKFEKCKHGIQKSTARILAWNRAGGALHR